MKKAVIVLHQERSISGDIGKKLIKRGFFLEIIRPCLGEVLPKNLEDYSLVVVLGGPISVNDKDLYIKYEINWLKSVIESEVPFLGICLGAQMLAKHLGCQVRKNFNNFSEIGFFNITPTKEGKKIFKDQTIFYQFHDEGFDVPNNCKLLATGDKFKFQAFKYKNCYAFQFHPEVDFYTHLRWLYFVIISKPKKLFDKGAQNIFIQLYYRLKYNKKISLWLDNFLDNYLIKN